MSKGDIVLWCDADITDFGSRFVVGLLGPLLTDPSIGFVKGFYERPAAGVGPAAADRADGPSPHRHPLPPPVVGHPAALGRVGGRRELLERLPFVRGYGVEIAMLIDVAEAVGVEGMAQVDLGTRSHRNQDLGDLGPQALVVLQAALDRAEVRSANPATLVRPGRPPLVRGFSELPPVASLSDRDAPPPPPRPQPRGRRARAAGLSREGQPLGDGGLRSGLADAVPGLAPCSCCEGGRST